MTRQLWLVALLTIVAAATLVPDVRAEPDCGAGHSRVRAEVVAVSRYVVCGSLGTTEAVIRFRILRHRSGPSVPSHLMGVLVCPPFIAQLPAGTIVSLCVGEVPEETGHRFDDFPEDPAPRIYVRVLRIHAARGR
jgi:hypothetical protein